MAALKDARFWGGVLVGALLLMFVPALNVRSRMGGRAGMG